jgi:hypothetical protein
VAVAAVPVALADGRRRQKTIAAVPWLAETSVGLELLGLTEQQIDTALTERRRLGGSAALRQIAEAAAARQVNGDSAAG